MPDLKKDIGRFRSRVALQSVAVATPPLTAAGVPPQTDARTWTTLGTYWACIEPQTIRRSAGFDAAAAPTWLHVTMRNPGIPVTTASRFLLDGPRILVIDGVQRIDEQSGFLSIECTENPAPAP